MELEGTRIISTSYLVGESLDKGKTWTFFDASNAGSVTPKDVKPNLSPGLNIPKKEERMEKVNEL